MTLADVARAAGVSSTTVSHVLNGTRPVSERTVRAVNDAVARTGYVPDSIARSLARGGTQSLGLAISAISNPYFAGVVGAVEAAATRAGYTLMLADTHDDPERETHVVRALLARRVDGLVLAPSAGAAAALLPDLAARGRAVVLVDRLPEDRLDQVGSENEQATARLVRHVAELGHRRIAMIAGLAGLTTTEERVRGYHAGLVESGLPADDALVADGASAPGPARDSVERLLALEDPPTAFVAGNNHMTIGVMQALAERGLRVPHDVALVAYDDFEWAEYFTPRLTVIAQRTREIGERAVELLLSRIADPGLPPRTVRLEPTFVHRTSCGCAPHD